MRARISRWLATSLLALVAPALLAAPAALAAPSADGHGWLGEELPLPLAVRTAQDLAIKVAAEKQYLIFNLLAGGKLAWDQGDFATAAAKWEALLRVQGLDPGDRQADAPAREGGARPGRRRAQRTAAAARHRNAGSDAGDAARR